MHVCMYVCTSSEQFGADDQTATRAEAAEGDEWELPSWYPSAKKLQERFNRFLVCLHLNYLLRSVGGGSRGGVGKGGGE